jgi:hypothetical protein
MSRSVFGWDLPPGCTQRHIDEAAGAYDICECCNRHIGDCICDQCQTCGEYGCPRCYSDDAEISHGMKYSKEQLRNQTLAKIQDLKQQIADNEAYLAQLEADPV